MRGALRDSAKKGLDLSAPKLGATIGAWNIWLADENKSLTAALGGFYEAPDLPSVMAHLLAIDILVSSLLAGIAKMRFDFSSDD